MFLITIFSTINGWKFNEFFTWFSLIKIMHRWLGLHIFISIHITGIMCILGIKIIFKKRINSYKDNKYFHYFYIFYIQKLWIAHNGKLEQKINRKSLKQTSLKIRTGNEITSWLKEEIDNWFFSHYFRVFIDTPAPI